MILRGKVSSASSASDVHRVKVTIPGVMTETLVDSVNGLYLRSGEEVYVYMMDNYMCPLVIGRCNGQFEISQLNDILNSMVNKFNAHIHPDHTALITFATTVSAATSSATTPVEIALVGAASALLGSISASGAPTTQMSTTKNDDFLY